MHESWGFPFLLSPSFDEPSQRRYRFNRQFGKECWPLVYELV